MVWLPALEAGLFASPTLAIPTMMLWSSGQRQKVATLNKHRFESYQHLNGSEAFRDDVLPCKLEKWVRFLPEPLTEVEPLRLRRSLLRMRIGNDWVSGTPSSANLFGYFISLG